MRYLREKLGDEERTLIRSVRGVGYAWSRSMNGVSARRSRDAAGAAGAEDRPAGCSGACLSAGS